MKFVEFICHGDGVIPRVLDYTATVANLEPYQNEEFASVEDPYFGGQQQSIDYANQQGFTAN